MIVNEQILDNYTQGTPCTNFYLEKIDGRKNHRGLHRHNFFQLFLLEKGTINQTIDFEHHTMEPQSASLIFPFQLHDFSLSPDAEAYMVMFDETVFCSEILHNDLKDYNIDLQKRVNYVAFNDKKETFQDITAIWQSINTLYKDFNLVNKMQIKLFIKIIIMKIINVCPERALVTTDNEDTSLYIAFREMVDRNFKENRIANSYASDLNVSVKRLTEVCRHFCGLTPLEVIHEKLNLELKKALAIGHMSIKEISIEFGFSSQAALNKYIEQKFAMTPVQLKNKLRNLT